MSAEDDDRPPLHAVKLGLVAALGAMAGEIIVAFSEGLTRAFTLDQVPSHLLAILVGAMIGWLVELSRQLVSAARHALSKINEAGGELLSLVGMLELSARAERVLNVSPRHRETLRQLLTASTRDKIDMIPQVGPGEYLRFLEVAIGESASHFGVQRNTISWYRDSNGGGYLEKLNERSMEYKVRLFVITDGDRAEMESNLQDPRLMDYYWTRSSTVESYWATEAEFRKLYPGMAIPDDFALYDGCLIIQYDESIGLLRFNVVGTDRDERRLQDRFMESPAPDNGSFRRITRSRE